MRRRGTAVTIAVAVAVIVVAELVVRVVAPRLPDPLRWNDHETQNKAALMERFGRRSPRTSAVFIGSSTMNAAADPQLIDRLTGARRPAFNAALNGADARSMEWWTTRVVVPRLHPQVVVVGTTSLELNDNGLTQADFFRKLTRSEGARQLTGALGPVGRIEAWFEDRSYLARYRTELRRPASIFNEDSDAERALVGPRGVLGAIPEFHRRPYAIPQEFKVRTERESYHDFTVGGRQLDALDRLAADLATRDITLVVVKMPITADLLAMHPHGRADYERYERALNRFADRRSIVFIDAAAEIRDRKFFVDPIHLNDEGMRRFTELLVPVLRRSLDGSS